AFIGRRTMSRGTFYDRRVFLISYDYTTDPTGEVLERLLLANGPVGAGISLEYYFSTVDNDNYGCGSKITHNITGMFGVMDGAGSDLRTGLPKQMIEIHEAMRLQIVVEASIEMLTKIYTRQPPLQELIGNGWLLVSAMDPETGEITLFKPDQGFVPWTGRVEPLPRVGSSIEWYSGHSEPLTPARIETEAAHG
ncbi:MAG: putative inorganic carbon transporter subunit DabA, partial [Candidatus Sedimenticola sp. (ex Thyasira tokunagai)]